jgi:MutS domain V/MutS domain I
MQAGQSISTILSGKESTEHYHQILDAKVELEPVVEDEFSLERGDDTPKNTSTRNNISNDLSKYEKAVDSLFGPGSQISDYWKEPLQQVTRPSAKVLLSQLDAAHCPMGYNPLAVPYDSIRGAMTCDTGSTTAGKKGTFLRFCRDAKQSHSECLLLTRCGDFYETFGIDAILLVEHCGLNAMAGKAKAGFPVRSIQAMLDCLTSKGFRMAVYEEALDTDASVGPAAKAGAKSRLKTRHLAQIVSPASPTYLYNLVLGDGCTDTSVASRPYMGVLSTAAGYTIVEISTEERSVQVSERLTAEAVACRLAAFPPTSPLFWVPGPIDTSAPPFMPSRGISVQVIPPSLLPTPTAGVDERERAKNVILSSLLQRTELELEAGDDNTRRHATPDDFTLIATSQLQSANTQTRALHVETATQLGLLHDPAIPSLLSSVLSDAAPAATRRFLRRYLLTPPPAPVCDAMGTLVQFLKNDQDTSLPPLAVPSLGKTLSLLRAGQASAQVYGELLQAMASTVAILELGEADGERKHHMVDPLLTIVEYETGMAAELESLKSRCLHAIRVIEGVVSPLHHAACRRPIGDAISNHGEWVPSAFFERNEAIWRGRCQPDVVRESYGAVQAASGRLAEAIARDFLGLTLDGEADLQRRKNLMVQDIFNNLLALKEIPGWSMDKGIYLHPRDRNGILLRNRYTTEAVKTALSDYVAACDEACDAVTAVLTKLSRDLHNQGHIPAIIQAAHANLIASTAFHHAQKANTMGWNRAEVYEDGDSAGYLDGVWPYWMHQSEAVPNTFELKDMFLLTAPNMAGKSSLMRATAAAALLSVCGFCAPLATGSVRRFDHLFVRGASSDIPTENKSAFGAEMSDVAALLRCCGPKSLAFVDELGRGTSPKDGTRLAGAVLEAMAKSGISGIFATHLHDILTLPLHGIERIVKKQMAILEDETHHKYLWTYRIIDGECTDSMALVTAAQFGLPAEVLARAEELSRFVPNAAAASSMTCIQRGDAHGHDDTTINGLPGCRDDEVHKVDGHDMHGVLEIVGDTSGQVPLSIPSHWNPPASLEGRSCVYVLRLEGSDEGRPCYYIGETDSFQQRLRQHRKKGGSWSSVEAIALPILGGKSESRAMESLLIQKLAKAGYALKSTHDGRSLRSVRQDLS